MIDLKQFQEDLDLLDDLRSQLGLPKGTTAKVICNRYIREVQERQERIDELTRQIEEVTKK